MYTTLKHITFPHSHIPTFPTVIHIMSQLENINNSSSLQEILFNMLLNDLQEQSDYLNKLLELFLAHTCKTDTSCKNDSINEFVNIHVAEATKHLESGFFEDQKQKW